MNKRLHRISMVLPILCLGITIASALLSTFDSADSDTLSALKTRSIGPAGMSGRIAARYSSFPKVAVMTIEE